MSQLLPQTKRFILKYIEQVQTLQDTDFTKYCLSYEIAKFNSLLPEPHKLDAQVICTVLKIDMVMQRRIDMKSYWPDEFEKAIHEALYRNLPSPVNIETVMYIIKQRLRHLIATGF